MKPWRITKHHIKACAYFNGLNSSSPWWINNEKPYDYGRRVRVRLSCNDSNCDAEALLDLDAMISASGIPRGHRRRK